MITVNRHFRALACILSRVLSRVLGPRSFAGSFNLFNYFWR